jgi:hypothetical protein
MWEASPLGLFSLNVKLDKLPKSLESLGSRVRAFCLLLALTYFTHDTKCLPSVEVELELETANDFLHQFSKHHQRYRKVIQNFGSLLPLSPFICIVLISYNFSTTNFRCIQILHNISQSSDFRKLACILHKLIVINFNGNISNNT